jgi:Fe-S oxidoreductase
MIIVERIILSHLTDEVLYLITCGYKEGFFELEELFLHVLGKLNFKFARPRDQQELLVEAGRRGKSDEFEDCIEAAVDFFLETHRVIVDD